MPHGRADSLTVVINEDDSIILSMTFSENRFPLFRIML
jgi:hypothetical protein